MFLELPKLKINIRLSKDGRILKEYSEPGHSWTRNAWNWLFTCLTDAVAVGTGFGAGNMTVRRNTGVISSAVGNTGSRASSATPTTLYGMTNSAQTTVTGIVVGMGDTAFSVDDHILNSLIAHGTGVNQLSYQAQTYPVTTYDAVSKIWKSVHSRSFLNQSAAAITVKEVGIHFGCQIFSSTTTYQHLFARDVLETPVEVQPSGVIDVSYEISMDFSEID
jgi:hypothetical protein